MKSLLALVLLSSGISYAQSYSTILRPGDILFKYAACRAWPNGPIVPACNITVSISNYPGTNAHTVAYHSQPAPTSRIYYGSSGPWSQTMNFNTAIGVSGQVILSLKGGQRWTSDSSYDVRQVVAQAETMRACPDGEPQTHCAVFDYAVGYPDIYWVEENPNWQHVGARPEHENSNSYNHWMVSSAALGIYNTAIEFLNRYPAQGQIAVNDMALPFAGLLDISAHWSPSHWNHGRGTAVDVRGNGGPLSIPNSEQDAFVSVCVLMGAYYGQVEFTGTDNQHIHCQWPNLY